HQVPDHGSGPGLAERAGELRDGREAGAAAEHHLPDGALAVVPAGSEPGGAGVEVAGAVPGDAARRGGAGGRAGAVGQAGRADGAVGGPGRRGSPAATDPTGTTTWSPRAD